MTTVGDIVRAAGRKIGVHDMDGSEINDGIEALNSMLKQWSASKSAVNAITRESFSISAGTASYTMGDGATIDSVWPILITSAFIRIDDTDYPLATFPAENYAYTGRKADRQRPLAIYYERTYPYGTLFFWPTPDSTYTVHLWSRKGFTEYTAPTTTVSLPPEYEPAMVYNLAIEMAPEYGKDPSAMVTTKAISTYRTIRNMNIHPVPTVSTNVIGSTRGTSDGLFDGAGTGFGFPHALPFVFRT